MSADPILVLQMQRMGDLILTFPLLLALKKRWPQHPVWVLAEPAFFSELMPLAPDVVFFPPSHCAHLPSVHYKAAINVSNRPEAAACMANLDAEIKLGPVSRADGQHILGFWQLYRAALTQNNRYNRFHWSDLYRMDLHPSVQAEQAIFTLPAAAGTGRVALVLGASEAGKRPQTHFWSKLARALAREGMMPIFLGGPAEKELGAEVARLARLPKADFCGSLPLGEVASVLRGVDLCITPDTGPMHLANWVGVPVLNLSMGPVQAWETGPSSPAQHVLRPALSCVGCWQCRRQAPFRCRAAFDPKGVQEIAAALMGRDHKGLPAARPPLCSMELLRTDRDAYGLYRLEPATAAPHPHRAAIQHSVEHFWHRAFLALYDAACLPAAEDAWQSLCQKHPRVARRVALSLVHFGAGCSAGLKTSAKQLSPDFWQAQPALIRLFAGFIHMGLQNADFSVQGWQQALRQLSLVSGLCRL